MKAFQILDVKPFMAKLLIQNMFDSFLLSEFTMNTFTKFQISGKLNQDFFSKDELEVMSQRTYTKWQEVKPFAYSIVKGNKTPLSFHITLMLSNEQKASVVKNAGVAIKLEDISGLYIHIKYENTALFIITGLGLNTFTLDKSLETAWDEQVANYLRKNEIAVIES